MGTVNGEARESGRTGGTELEDVCCFLDRVYARPALARELSRVERVAAFSQLMFVAGPIMSAFVEVAGGGDLKTPDFALADDLWTARETAAKLRINVRTLYTGIKTGKYPFAIIDGRIFLLDLSRSRGYRSTNTTTVRRCLRSTMSCARSVRGRRASRA